MKFRARTVALLAAGMLLGMLLAPVAAQQTPGRSGQIAVRSDGAVYLVMNDQRRWVSTVIISDDELNAIPEAEPIYAGLVPGDSGLAPRASSPSSSSSSSDDRRTPTPTRTGSSSSSSSSGSSSGGVAIDQIQYDKDVRAGGLWTVVAIVSQRGAGNCELEIRWADDEEAEEAKVPNNDFECEFNVDVPSNVELGDARFTLTYRDGDKKAEERGTFKVNAS
jgi:hypothetical protein